MIVRREDGVAVGGQDAIEVDVDVQEDIGEWEIRALQPPKICFDQIMLPKTHSLAQTIVQCGEIGTGLVPTNISLATIAR